ncbi:MAG: AAA family ATPase [Coriobacteriaceae bacterium]|nr:AAA family ATPase [Coriobacteriaceae bacterium]
MSEFASPLPPALQQIQWNIQVRDFLAFAVSHEYVSHAYLFVGPAGSGKTEAALALAQCIVCPCGGDGTCQECQRVAHGTHPDVQVMQPESATGYLVSQARELTAQAAMTPVRAQRKVYILHEAGKLGGVAANALLKTIEEPPSDVVFILIARSVDQLLPTIASRCQQVFFHVASEQDACALIQSQTAADAVDARIALSIAQTPSKAAELLSSSKRWEARTLAIHTLAQLAQLDDWDILLAAQTFVEAAGISLIKKSSKKENSTLTEEEKERIAIRKEYLSTSAIHRLGEADKREQTAQARSGIMEMLAALSSVLRDVLLRSEGVGQDIVNSDVADVVEQLASACATEGVFAALDALNHAADDLSHNVTPQLAIEAMLLRIKEALICPPRSR